MKRILVAVDRSEPSMRAVDMAADIALKFGAELMLQNVVQDLGPDDPAIEAYARIENIRDGESALKLESIRDSLSDVCSRAEVKGVCVAAVDVTLGDPAEEILANAKSGAADLIVMGNRGHGRLAGLLLGSVTQKVVGLASCPVLVVH